MIVGICGYAQSGKDTVADYLVKRYGFDRLAFADPLRAFLAEVYLYFEKYEEFNTVFGFDWVRFKEQEPETYRRDLQWAGADLVREYLFKQAWVLAWHQKVLHKYGPKWTGEKIVIPDVRFANEMQHIWDSGGEIWVISRAGVSAANDHISEHEWANRILTEPGDEEPWIVIYNNSTKEDLFKQVDDLFVRTEK